MFARRIDSHTLIVGAPAKVNLFLEVLGKRPDGYHDIHSLFQSVSLFDRLTFSRNDSPGECALVASGTHAVPTDSSNLVVRAYAMMAEKFDLRGGMAIDLEKRIPVAAGLAGGSSDAAATIVATNVLFDLGLTFEEMAELSLKIGSDVPFFFSSGQAIVTGRGENIQNVDLPTDYWLVLVTPNFPISTADSYAQLDLTLTKQVGGVSFCSCKALRELIESLKDRGNDFEKVHLGSFPDLAKIKDGLLDKGAHLARLSGSGPTVFGLYIDLPELPGDSLNGRDDWRVHPVRPIVLPARLP